MRAYSTKIIALVLLIFLQISGFSQISGCNASQNACSNPNFALVPGAAAGLPSTLNISNPTTNPAGINSGCLLSSGPGPNWMIITVGSSGMLGFSFGTGGNAAPCHQTGFYDWAMWAYDANTCTKIFNNTLPPVACNWNAQASGGTGMGVPPAGASVGNFQPSIPVTAGQQFIILLSNYSSVSSCVSIVSNGSANLTCSPLILPSFIRCPGQQAVMTAVWAANVSNVSYTLTPNWPITANTATIQTSPTFVVAPLATQIYTVVASGYNNTLNSVVTTSNTFTVTISPTTTMQVTANPICYGTQATLTALSAGTNYTLTSPAPAPVLNSVLPVMVTPPLTTSGSYTMGTTLFSGCTATGAVQVDVSPNTTFTVNPPLNVCLNGNIQLTATLSPLTNNYLWQFPNAITSTSQNPTRSGMQVSDGGIYTVKASFPFSTVNGSTLCPMTATTQVSVIPTSPVAISASPSQTLCQGTSLQLSSSISGVANNFIWAGPNSFNTSVQSTTLSNLVPANSGIYTTTAVFANAFLSCPITNTVKIVIVGTAIPTISIPPTVCQNDTAHLVMTTAGSPASVLWLANAFGTTGSTNASTVIASIQPTASGQYLAYAFYTGGTSVTCTTQVSGQLNVVAVNTINIIAPPPTCRPGDVAIYSSAVGAVSYNWAGPNNFSEHQANPILSHPDINASGIYTVTAGFTAGGLLCFNTNTVAVTVNPVLNFTLIPHQGNCEGGAITINGPPGASSYTWTTSGGTTFNQQNIVIPTLLPSDQGIYNLSVSLGPCVTTQSSVVDVYGRMEQTFFQQSMTICKGEEVTFKTGYTGSTGNPAVIWNPSVYLNSPTSTLQTGVKPQGTTIYTIKAYDVLCPAYFITHTFTVNVLTAAKPALELAKTRGCAPLDLYYDSKVDLEKSIVTYDFIGSNGWSRRLQRDAFTFPLEEAGSYILRIRTTTLFDETEKVCTDSMDYPVPLVVDPKPGSDITWFPASPTISENNVTFMSSAKNGPVVSTKWSFSGTYNDTVNAAMPQRLFEYTGKYPVKLTSTNEQGCSDTVTKYIEIKDDFNVYIPNSFTPNGDNLNDIFQLKGTGIRQEVFSMDIFDRWGSLLFSTKDPAKGWDGTAKGQQLGEGVYVYKIKLSGSNGEGKKEYLGQVTLIR